MALTGDLRCTTYNASFIKDLQRLQMTCLMFEGTAGNSRKVSLRTYQG